MTAYNYSNISAQTTLASGITPTSQVVSLSNTAGLPVSFPFTLIIDYGQANVEVVTATGLNGTNYTVTRGEDGTAAQGHNPGAVVVHGVAARDLKGPQDHMAASTGVHGVAGAVVGTTDAQTLSNKTIDGATNTLTVRDADISGLSASKLTGSFSQINGTLYNSIRASPTSPSVQAQVSGDAVARFNVRADGLLSWGTGSAAQDTTLGRPNLSSWNAYTPTWTTDNGNNSLGNGSVMGRYIQIGKTVHYTGRLLLGSTTNVGSGGWCMSYPVPLQETGNGAFMHVGSMYFNASNARGAGIVRFQPGVAILQFGYGAGVLDQTSATWASGNELRWSITYEAA